MASFGLGVGLAVESDRYNPKALVNQGNVFFHQGKYVDAESAYVEAMSLEADLIEAVYNLGMSLSLSDTSDRDTVRVHSNPLPPSGLLNKRLERFNTALQNFKLVYKLMPTSLDVLYQMGDMYVPSLVDMSSTLFFVQDRIKNLPFCVDIYTQTCLVVCMIGCVFSMCQV